MPDCILERIILNEYCESECYTPGFKCPLDNDDEFDCMKGDLVEQAELYLKHVKDKNENAS